MITRRIVSYVSGTILWRICEPACRQKLTVYVFVCTYQHTAALSIKCQRIILNMDCNQNLLLIEQITDAHIQLTRQSLAQETENTRSQGSEVRNPTTAGLNFMLRRLSYVSSSKSPILLGKKHHTMPVTSVHSPESVCDALLPPSGKKRYNRNAAYLCSAVKASEGLIKIYCRDALNSK